MDSFGNCYARMFFTKWKIKIVQHLKHLYEIKTTETANAQTCRELWSSGTAVVPIDKKQMSLGLFSIGEAPSHTLITTKWTGLESCSYVLKRRRGVSFFKRIKIVYDHNHPCEIKATQTARCANCEVWSSGKNGNHNDEMDRFGNWYVFQTAANCFKKPYLLWVFRVFLKPRLWRASTLKKYELKAAQTVTSADRRAGAQCRELLG